MAKDFKKQSFAILELFPKRILIQICSSVYYVRNVQIMGRRKRIIAITRKRVRKHHINTTKILV